MKIRCANLCVAAMAALPFFLFLTACGQRQGGKTAEDAGEEPLPEGAVAFEYYNDHIYLHSFLEDSTECNVVFDTGLGLASLYLYLDSTFVSESKPGFIDSSEIIYALVGGVGDKRKLTRLYKDSTLLTSGNIRIPHAGTLFVNLRDILGRKADGITGLPLDGSAWEINYGRHYLRRLERSRVDSLKDFTAFPIKIEDGRLLVYCTVRLSDGVSSEGWFIIDTGSGGSIFFTAEEASKRHFEDLDKPVSRYVSRNGGLGGESASFQAYADYAVFGKDTLHCVSLEWYDGRKGVMAGGAHKGIIGNEMLCRYNMVLDLRDSLIYLQDNLSYEKLPSGEPWGIAFVDRTDVSDTWIVGGLRQDSPADKAGVELGDSITMIDGRRVADLDVEDAYRMLDSLSSAGLTIRKGSETIKRSMSR